MHHRLVAFILLVALAVPVRRLPAGWAAVGALTPAAEAAAESTSAQGTDAVYFVEWNITASGQLDEASGNWTRSTRHTILVTGSAVVHKPPSGFLNTIPFQLTVTDDYYEVETNACSEAHTWWSIDDPARYSGGPDAFWVHPDTFWPQQRADGSWFLNNPFQPHFWVNGQLIRSFDYRLDYRSLDCDGSITTGSALAELASYGTVFAFPGQLPFQGDATGTTFTLSTSYVINLGYDLHVNFYARIRVACAAAAALAVTGPEGAQRAEEVCSCQSLPAPIEYGSPYLTSLDLRLEGADPTPDTGSYVTVAASCEGVPVKNVPVEVAVRALEGSGGHDHGGANRPRGYLDGTEITAQAPSILVTTGQDGQAQVFFEPGRDLTEHARGIGGFYSLKARVIGYTPRWEELILHAHLPLEALSEGAHYTVVKASAGDKHFSVYYGTPSTLQAIAGMAAAWNTLQLLHNDDLEFYGHDAWPIVPLQVWTISLPDGGLFDHQGSQAWHIPYREHRFGTDVHLFPDLDAAPSGIPASVAQVRAWMLREFRQLGSLYGSWFSDGGSAYNLAIGRSVPLALLPAAAADGPDVASSAILSDPPEQPVAGPGQTVTYSLGVENRALGTVAADVVVTGSLPAGLDFVSANPAPSSVAGNGIPVWSIGSLPAEGVPRIITLIAQVNPAVVSGSVLTLTAAAGTTSVDANPANNTFAAWGLTVQPPGPDVVVNSGLDATALTVGAPVTFTIDVINQGNTPAAGSVLTLTVPPSITITSVSPATSTTIMNGVAWSLGSLAAGTGRPVTVTVRVHPALLTIDSLAGADEPDYPLAFVMTVGTGNSDIDPANNTLQVAKRAVRPGPDLLLDAKAVVNGEGMATAGSVVAGQPLSYTLLYANLGNRPDEGVTAHLQLWPGLSLVSSQPAPSSSATDPASGVTTLTWDLNSLAVGEDGVIELQLESEGAAAGNSILVARLATSGTDINPANNAVVDIRSVPANAVSFNALYLPLVSH